MRGESLVATLGTQPQVVTLVLDELRKRGFGIGRVVAIHTDDSQEPMRSCLSRLRAEFREYYSAPEPIEAEFIPLDGIADILTEEDAGVVFRTLYRTVLGEKRSGRRVHLSIAGGRKVMSVYGMAVAQLLFDDDDRVWHLVSEEVLHSGERLHASPGEEVVLVPVPILRWSMISPVMTELVLREDPWEALRVYRRKVERGDQIQLMYFLEQELRRSERKLVELLVREGLTNKELATRLGKSEKTVANQLSAVYEKYKRYRGLRVRPNRSRLISDLRSIISGNSS